MSSQQLFEQFKCENCHVELIHLFLSVSFKSSFLYMSSVFLFVWFLYDFIPLDILIPWVGIQFAYLLSRLLLVHKYKGKTFTLEQKKQLFNEHTLLLFIGGLTWGVGSFICVLYAPSPYEYIVFALLIGISAGSIATLSALYRLYAVFNIPILLILISSFIYRGESVHYYIALVSLLFLIVAMSASWTMHESLIRSVELNDLYAQSQDKLSQINSSLEERIAKEVENNRIKDQQMLSQSRLAQMGEMISMIAHQWRQPLASISAISGTLSIDVIMDNYKKEFFQERLESISELSQHLSSTIDDFRGFFKEDKELINISISELFESSLHIIGPTLASKGIIVEAKIKEEISLYTYPNEIRQVILNLIKNSEEAIEENKVHKGKIRVHAYEKENRVYLSIEDNAGGIPKEIIDKVFDPYFTTKSKMDGTGLGLYMSKMIIEEHCGGKLIVQNKDDGACFILTIPCT